MPHHLQFGVGGRQEAWRGLAAGSPMLEGGHPRRRTQAACPPWGVTRVQVQRGAEWVCGSGGRAARQAHLPDPGDPPGPTGQAWAGASGSGAARQPRGVQGRRRAQVGGQRVAVGWGPGRAAVSCPPVRPEQRQGRGGLAWGQLEEAALPRSLSDAGPSTGAGRVGGPCPGRGPGGEGLWARQPSAHQVAVHLAGVDAEDHARVVP